PPPRRPRPSPATAPPSPPSADSRHRRSPPAPRPDRAPPAARAPCARSSPARAPSPAAAPRPGRDRNWSPERRSPRCSRGRLHPLDPVILDDGVGEQPPAHLLDRGVADALVRVELDQLAGADVVDAGKAES